MKNKMSFLNAMRIYSPKFFVLILLASYNLIKSQIPIDPYMFGQNVYYLPKGNNSIPSNLDNFYSIVKASGVASARIGGTSYGFSPMYSFSGTSVTNANGLIYIINKLLNQSIEPVIQIGFEDQAMCTTDIGPLGSTSNPNQALIAKSLITFLINYYISNPHTVYGHWRPKYIIIGNEPDRPVLCSGDGDGYGLDGSSSNYLAHAGTIATYITEFSKRIKEADPNIKTIGPEIAAFGNDAGYSVNKVMDYLISSPSLNPSTSIMGSISNPGNPGDTKNIIDIVSFHYYPQGMSISSDIISNPTDVDGFKEKLVANNPSSIPPRKGIIAMIGQAGRSINDCRIACTEFNLPDGGGALDESNSSDFTTLVNGITNRSYIAGQWMADIFSQAMEINSSNKPWVQFMMPWSILEGQGCDELGGNTLGYISACTTGVVNRKRSTYWHYNLVAKYMRGDFYRGNCSDGNIKVFSAYGCNGLTVMIMNQNSSSTTAIIDLNFNSTYPSTSNTKIKLNIPTSWTLPNYNFQINGESTKLLIYDACKNLKNVVTYSKSNYLNNQDPSGTPTSGQKYCKCTKIGSSPSPAYSLRCAIPTETGTVHYNGATLSSNTTISDSAFITGRLTVPNGITLTIDTAEVVFSSNASISVYTGGKLIIRGSNLHGCSDSTWKGIEINGNNSVSQFTITGSRITNAVIGIKASQTNAPVITDNVITKASQGIRLYQTTGFTISGNEFTEMPMCISTSGCASGTSLISENLFFRADTAIKSNTDTHTGLDITCNGFVDYSRYGIYCTDSQLKDQGSTSGSPNNYFSSINSLTNHQLYFMGRYTMTYYCGTVNTFTLSTSGYGASVTNVDAEGTCTTIEGRLAHYGIESQTSNNVISSKLFSSVPNPTSGKTTFNYVLAHDTKTAEIKLTDMFGQPVNKLSLNPGSRSIDADVSGLTNGLYFYTLYVNGTAVDSKKLVLSK